MYLLFYNLSYYALNSDGLLNASQDELADGNRVRGQIEVRPGDGGSGTV